MSKIFFSVIVAIVLSGCAGPTYYVNAGQSANWQAGPGQEAYKYVLVQNQSPYFVKICPGQTILLDPGAEVILKRTRPLGWIGPSFGNFRFMAYAYREYNPQTGQIDWFVGQKEARVNLDGRVRTYNGRVFADRIRFGSGGWHRPSWGHPDKWEGSFLGIVPWEMKFRHR
jgi:hypothetical protein